MANTNGMHVFERLKELVCVETGDFFIKFTAERNKVKELSALSKLEHDVIDLLGFLLLRRSLCSLSRFMHLDHVGMAHFFKDVQLSLDEVGEVAALDEFDGETVIVLVLRELDFAADSRPEGSSELVLAGGGVEESWHIF